MLDRQEGDVFSMDGIEHIVGNRNCCRVEGYMRTHKECGGLLHYQAIYGGWYYECDICGEIGTREMENERQ